MLRNGSFQLTDTKLWVDSLTRHVTIQITDSIVANGAISSIGSLPADDTVIHYDSFQCGVTIYSYDSMMALGTFWISGSFINDDTVNCSDSLLGRRYFNEL